MPFDFFQRDERSAVAAGAMRGGFGPGFGGVQDRVPKRPGAALLGAGVVDFAAAPLVVEENTIAVGQFDQALADADQPDVLLLEFRHVQF